MHQLRQFLALSVFLAVNGAVFAQSKDPFDESNKAAPRVGTQEPGAQESLPRGGGIKLPQIGKFARLNDGVKKEKATPIDDRVDLSVEVTPTKVRRGELVTITVRGVLQPGFHTDPMTKRADDPEQPATALSKFVFKDTPGLKPLPPIRETGETDFDVVKNVGTKLVYRKDFTWSQDLLVLPDSQPGPRTLRFAISMQVCNDKSCVPGTPNYEQTIEVSAEPAVALTPEITKRLKELQPPPTVVPLPGASAVAPNPVAKVDAPAPRQSRKTLLGMILLSMGAALAMLCTPCVFPMIPITVSICLNKSQKEHHNALLTAGIYSLTIVVMLTASVLLLGGLVVSLANNVWMNLALGIVMIYFALSLFGMYEIELPSGLARFTNAREDKGGLAGVIFMALTFTITSFTCTGPFLGPILAATKETEMSFGERLISSFSYSVTFAAPFFVLAIFPGLTKKLPKSGGWLNSVKVVMGFIEIALAFKFLSISDLAFFPGRPVLFNYDTVLCGWIGLSIACGLYLLGLFRLPHDSPVEHLSVPRMLLAGMFLSFAIYIAPALWRVTPQGIIGQGIVAFLPLDTRIQQGEQEWTRDYHAAYEKAVASGKLIFIDFTGQNCSNCRYNEKNIFPLPEIQQELKKYVKVQLYTDSVPDPSLSAAQAEKIGIRNSELRANTFNDSSNPLYAIIQPRKQSGPFVDQDGVEKLTGADRNWVRKGLISEAQIPDFLEFLRKPLQGAGAGLANVKPANQVLALERE
jgi:thiol:disulfide interchange protein DsbD